MHFCQIFKCRWPTNICMGLKKHINKLHKTRRKKNKTNKKTARWKTSRFTLFYIRSPLTCLSRCRHTLQEENCVSLFRLHIDIRYQSQNLWLQYHAICFLQLYYVVSFAYFPLFWLVNWTVILYSFAIGFSFIRAFSSRIVRSMWIEKSESVNCKCNVICLLKRLEISDWKIWETDENSM